MIVRDEQQGNDKVKKNYESMIHRMLSNFIKKKDFQNVF